MEKRLGVIISVESLLAALLLFGILLIVVKLSNLDSSDNSEIKILRLKAQQVHLMLANTGAYDQVLLNQNDSTLRQTIAQLPAGLCTQIEIFDNSISAENLNYSHLSANCTMYQYTPISTSMTMHLVRQNSSSYTYHPIRVSIYGRG
jgi:hypothetical protein